MSKLKYDVGHLNRGIIDYTSWKTWWRELTVMLERQYDALGGKLGQNFVR